MVFLATTVLKSKLYLVYGLLHFVRNDGFPYLSFIKEQTGKAVIERRAKLRQRQSSK
jgi:hypothetical protein